MSRRQRLLLLIALPLVLLVAWGWLSTRGNRGDGESPGPPPAEQGLLADWSRPALALVLSGEQLGYLEPCGCAENQAGGISRRADLFRQLRERGWPVSGLDLGGLVKRPGREQSQVKYQTLLAALGDMQYAALGIGPRDLALGPGFLLSQNSSGDDAGSRSGTPPLLAANLVLFDEPELPGAPAASVRTRVGKLTVSVIAVIGATRLESLRTSGYLKDITVRPPADVLPGVLEDLEDQPSDLLVLLSQADVAESEALARKFPQFDLVVSAGGPEDPLVDNPRQIGNTMFVTVGQKGKYAGVIGFDPAAEPRLRFELVTLDPERFRDSPAMNEHMRTYQRTLREANLAATMLPISYPGGTTFVGAARCGECHTKALAKWKATPHFGAFDSLETGRAGQHLEWVSRKFDAECLSCHVTGWHPQDVLRYKSGYVDEQTSPHLLGNQCENCHGAGSRHIELIEQDKVEAARAEVRVSLKWARQSLCIQCHDLDNSPKFNFDKYWKRVDHPGLD